MADFGWIPDNTIDSEIEFKTLVSEFENGVEQRRQKRYSDQKRWGLSFANRTKTETDAIRAFFESKKGMAISFTWENPEDSKEYTVRFGQDKLSIKRLAFGVYSFQIIFIEVI